MVRFNFNTAIFAIRPFYIPGGLLVSDPLGKELEMNLNSSNLMTSLEHYIIFELGEACIAVGFGRRKFFLKVQYV